jgi:hypothetical protein
MVSLLSAANSRADYREAVITELASYHIVDQLFIPIVILRRFLPNVLIYQYIDVMSLLISFDADNSVSCLPYFCASNSQLYF